MYVKYIYTYKYIYIYIYIFIYIYYMYIYSAPNNANKTAAPKNDSTK